MADYTFKINTPAELAGVESAIQRFEQLRGVAKANGKDFSELEQKLTVAKASIEAYHAEQARLEQAQAQLTTAVTSTGAAIEKTSDETDRYTARLRQLAIEAARAANAQRQAADAAAENSDATAAAGDDSARYEQHLREMALQSSVVENEQRRAAEAATEAGKASEGAGEKTRLFANHSKELSKVIRELSKDFPIAGLALKAFANPIAATLTVAVGFFVAIRRQIDETNKKLDEMAALNAKPLNDFATAFRQAQNEATAANKEFLAGMEAFATANSGIAKDADAAVAAIHRLTAAQLELNNAAQAKAVAEVNLREEQKKITPAQAIAQRAQIKDFYEQQKNKTQDQAESAEITRREAELAALQQRRNQLAGIAGAGDNSGRIGGLKDQAKNADEFAKDLGKQRPELQAAIDALNDQLSTINATRPNDPGDAAALTEARKTVTAKRDAAITELDDLDQRIAQANKLAEVSNNRAAQLERQAVAAKSAEEEAKKLTEQLDALKREIEELRKTAELNKSVRSQTYELNRDTRGLETQKDQSKAEEEARQKAKQENDRKAREAEEEINRRPRSDINSRRGRRNFSGEGASAADVAVIEEGFNDASVNIGQLTATVVAGLTKLNQQLADSTSRVSDAANNV